MQFELTHICVAVQNIEIELQSHSEHCIPLKLKCLLFIIFNV